MLFYAMAYVKRPSSGLGKYENYHFVMNAQRHSFAIVIAARLIHLKRKAYLHKLELISLSKSKTSHRKTSWKKKNIHDNADHLGFDLYTV